ncbi:hybrid sensor histidine kinase/response regulator [Shewanella inventionis]|uniref:histidine kinase n=1 Tax=Shewanella inventionis TaxID=1738770 RepID=A0ABQ1IWR5_9GAMM|nr:PAS domain-containing hybrid sensor histidine kinase/response regulator [Shewanella inventionis]MCL1158534.1 hybrid sensor histidine kinase/response regulator [Shewanella inventionis]UAL44407.1 hybrid sensor histidine kinase/response regulator [Shewanella inventionis]GGB52333.1 two-component sensor [Shewanella inventionis]
MQAWLSIDAWLISLISIAYLAMLFVVAQWGQNQAVKKVSQKPWIYSLSLGVCCTSWAFYGTVGQAATTGAWLAPIYIGSIICLVLAWPMLIRTLHIIKSQNLTSIADFIACRFDRSPKLAASVAIVSLLGTIPYIALQLRAISTSFDLLTGTFQSGISTAFVVTIVLIIFSVLFGARQLSASKHNHGLVLAIAFSSIVKLLALTAVGIFATFYLFDGFGDLLTKSQSLEQTTHSDSIYLIVSQVILGAITMYALPQEFHMMMIENNHDKELKSARWMVPLYLLLINIFVLPIALAGQLSFPGGSVGADTYVLTLPLFYQQAWLGILVYIGGLAAATAMVIVAAIVLSTMISTEMLTPLLLRLSKFSSQQTPQLSGILLNLRRVSIAVILLSAFAFERFIDQQNHLASIGLLSFVLLSQFAPAAIGALYWRNATTQGAFVGLIMGSIVWLYTLLLPVTFPDAHWVKFGLFDITWLTPTALFGLTSLDSISHGVFYSLAANIGCFVIISLLKEQSVGEVLQADLFVNRKPVQSERHLSIDDLASLLNRFINKDEADALLTKAKQLSGKHQQQQLVDYTRLKLSGVLGSASTRMVMNAASRVQHVPLEDVVSIVDEASQIFEFNRELLQSGVENIEQGISVVDADMRLVAWNQRYIELLDYPQDFVKAGLHIEQLIRFNIDRGIIVGDEAHQLVEKRLTHMRGGSPHHFQRTMLNGKVLEIRGQAMPGGGFVSTFADITAHIEAEKALQLANETLEKRVESRTQELEKAKAEAEAANSSKTRFLAAASHDLMQPFNALTLFTDMLKQRVKSTELQDLASNIEESLNVVESLLSDLVEISRLDSKSLKTEQSQFAIDDLLSTLVNEFNALSIQQGIDFKYQMSSCFVQSDQRLLRRIIQNFLSNAFHYSPSGKTKEQADHQGKTTAFIPKVLLGVRRLKQSILIQVWDNGPGIPLDKQQAIFTEFERLELTREIPGLGLGLAICDRIAKLLNVTISLHSEIGKGTCFSVEIPRVLQQRKPLRAPEITSEDEINSDSINVTVLVIDNDDLMLKAISSLLSGWGCQVITAKDQSSAIQQLIVHPQPKLIIADYHLEDDKNGVDLVEYILANHLNDNNKPTCIICSADPSESVRQHTSSAQFSFVRKPLKAIALKRIIKQLPPE